MGDAAGYATVGILAKYRDEFEYFIERKRSLLGGRLELPAAIAGVTLIAPAKMHIRPIRRRLVIVCLTRRPRGQARGQRFRC
jgi:hypothetical protein